MSGPVEFTCIDCGAFVLGFGYVEAPPPTRCSVCAWIFTCPIEHQPILRALLHETRREDECGSTPSD